MTAYYLKPPNDNERKNVTLDGLPPAPRAAIENYDVATVEMRDGRLSPGMRGTCVLNATSTPTTSA